MWIRTQNKQRIVNTDQVTDIFINNIGTSIIAHVSMPNDTRMVYLGEYENRDTCLKVLESIMNVIGTKLPLITMPLGGEIETWSKDIGDLAVAYITNDFRVK